MNGLPDKAWVKVLFQWGPVTAIVFFLLLQSAGWVPSLAGEIKDTLTRHDTTHASDMKAQGEDIRSLLKSQQEATRLQRLACLREAKSEADRQACLQ